MNKRRLVADVNTVISACRTDVRLHREQSGELNSFFAALQTLVHSEVPELDSTLTGLGTLFTANLAGEAQLADAEDRLAEDMNDICARFDVVHRLSEESIAAETKAAHAREAIERTRRALSDDLARGGAKQACLQRDIDAAMRAKGDAIRTATAKLAEYIDARTR
jgi:hypothetical protein